MESPSPDVVIGCLAASGQAHGLLDERGIDRHAEAGPDGTFNMPFSLLRDDVSELTGRESSRPLYSWNGPAFGTQEAKWAT